ncbi:SH3 domain-containing protein [uncultured Microscilla sp.]|uniref:SH3 domain-containing protein n=1 Tax=uncultured Microscilla sp. TaxID=432653 RepID=UPI00262C6935|nr:SH3 domain-containing protein [uncultured Microscilla sp.]
MKITLFKSIILGALCLWIATAQAQPSSLVINEAYYYVFAPNGLILRQSPNTSTKKIAKLPYGTKVKYLAGVPSKQIIVDNLKGGMAKVSYQGKTGYVFEGYLSKFAAPVKNAEVSKYADLLRKNGVEVMNEKIKRDWGGYQQIEEAIILNTQKWSEAFLVAKQLFGIPANMHFPIPTGQTTFIVKNPKKKKHVWTDQIEVKNNRRGYLQSIVYSSRQEGGGMHVSIKKSTNHNAKGFRLSVVYIVD